MPDYYFAAVDPTSNVVLYVTMAQIPADHVGDQTLNGEVEMTAAQYQQYNATPGRRYTLVSGTLTDVTPAPAPKVLADAPDTTFDGDPLAALGASPA